MRMANEKKEELGRLLDEVLDEAGERAAANIGFEISEMVSRAEIFFNRARENAPFLRTFF